MFAGRGDEDGVGQVAARGAFQFAREGARVVGVVEPHVVDRHALRPELLGKVPHRRQDEGDLLLVVRDVGGLLRHLDHQHRVGGGVEAVEGRDRPGELVAEDEAEGGYDSIQALNKPDLPSSNTERGWRGDAPRGAFPAGG